MKQMLLFLFSAFLFSTSNAQSFTEVEQIMLNNQKQLGDDQALIIYKDGKVLYQKMLGDFRPNIQAPIGESSQWLTAALVMIMVQEGKISLDDNVGKYLPIFPKWMKGYISIRHCLSHTTGIETDKQGAGKLFQRKSFSSLEEEVNYYAEKRAIANNPGNWFQYDQIGPSIVGRVLEVVTKKKFDRLAQEKLFRPLNMRITSFSNYTSAISPFDGAKSSAVEYTNFLSMLLNKGMFNGKQILTEASIAEMMKLQTGTALNKYTPPFMNGFSYGLGTWRETADGKVVNCVSQNSPFIWIDYCRGYGCILLAKKERDGLKRELYDQLKAAVDAQLTSTCK
ncbi:serine hydrolase domain-containing protein [Lacibacter sp.]|uniref:serine hydrolase domain-containing protein n=1 Tax=Lacibacter sp. TaxID=1915409 RepID=UPI002B4AD9B4|nr:serine hydrolase domain-containing protein [Lacibacter sp.]HLP35903.1 serine hydrolase domain-containing protein [Lacibacter sp.]